MLSDPSDLSPTRRRLIGIWVVLAFVLRALFGTLLGNLLLSIALYVLARPLLSIEPWSSTQLVLWIDSLSSEAKVGLATSLVTIAGFLVALRTSMQLWQRQTAANMRFAAAAKVDSLLNEISACLLRTQIFCEPVAREVRPLKTDPWATTEATTLTALLEPLERFAVDRKRILELQSQLFTLAAEHSVLMMPIPGAERTFERLEEQVGAVTEKLWVKTPSLGAAHPGHRKEFVDVVDPDSYEALASQCEISIASIAGTQGALRGYFHGQVVEWNLVSLKRIVQACFSTKD
jgi:hypothetical protein